MSPQCCSPTAATCTGSLHVHTHAHIHACVHIHPVEMSQQHTHTCIHSAPRAPHPLSGYPDLIFASDHMLTLFSPVFALQTRNSSQPLQLLAFRPPATHTHVRHRICPDNCYQTALLYKRPAPFNLLSLITSFVPKLVPLQMVLSPPIHQLWFFCQTLNSKSHVMPKCSSLASHNASHNHRE